MKTRIEDAFEKWRADFIGTHTGYFKMVGTDDLSNIAFIAGAEFMHEDMQATLEEAESEIILRGENFNKVKAQNDIMREALEHLTIGNNLSLSNRDMLLKFIADREAVAIEALAAIKDN